MRRGGAALILSGLLTAALFGRPLGAQSDEAIKHFHAGVALYQQTNFAGALVEFEEAYRLHPTPSALQNMALCQKALFRYADAVATLERMLREYGGALAAADAEAARAAVEEMRPLVASVLVVVSPPDAQVTIDDRPVTGGAERRVDVSVGEHRIVAEASRHQRYEQVVKLAGGARRVEVTLAPREGLLTVVAEDSDAVVAVDGVPRGYGSWRGKLSAGEAHAVRIWKPGHLERTVEVVLEQGEGKELHLPVGPLDAASAVMPPPPARAAARRGYYAFVTASVYVLGGDPDGFQSVKGDGSARDGSYFGVRLGDRLVPNFGLELMFEAGKHNVGQVCSPPAAGDCVSPQSSYGLLGQRLGINGKYFSSGDRVRFIAALGFGGVNHTLITQAPADPAAPGAVKPGSGSALNAYVFAEAGLELNVGHALIDGMLTGAVDGVNNLELNGQAAYTHSRDANMIGLGVRVGYGQWLAPSPNASEACPMTDSGESNLSRPNESRRFEPPQAFREKARVRSREEYLRLHRESLESPEAFYRRETAGLRFRTPFTEVSSWKAPHARWFDGATLNITESCLDQHLETEARTRAAIIWEGEPEGGPGEGPEIRTLTYFELHRQVVEFAQALSALGVGKGDRVVIYMGMTPEVVVAMLAVARLGAVHSVVFGGFAAEALRDRVNDCQAKVIVTQDGAYRRGNVIAMKSVVDRALEGAPTVEKVVVYERLGAEKAPVEWKAGRDLRWHEAIAGRGASGGREACVVEAEHPLFILYTSGSTGKPKGVLHTTAGYLVGAHLTTRYVMDLRPGDVFWCTADVGWVTGHSYVVYGPLSNGATVLMYEGAPNAPDPGRFWRVVERHGVSILYTAPTAIRAFMRWGEEWPKKSDLSSLRLIGSVGEPINPEAWIWYHKTIGQERCPVIDTWWQTETGSILLTTLPGAVYAKPGSTGLPFFGVEIDVVKKGGERCADNESGYLVLKRPWPSILRTIWGDDERFRKQYFSEIDGVYFTGDGARRDQDGYFWVVGRIDDVLNVAGHRVGTAEIESALVAHPSVAEAAAVGRPDDLKGQALVVFVTLKMGQKPGDQMRTELLEQVARDIGKFARPDEIRFTDALPKTRSGKIMRRLLKEVAAGKPTTGDTSTLEDLGVLAALRKDEE